MKVGLFPDFLKISPPPPPPPPTPCHLPLYVMHPPRVGHSEEFWHAFVSEARLSDEASLDRRQKHHQRRETDRHSKPGVCVDNGSEIHCFFGIQVRAGPAGPAKTVILHSNQDAVGSLRSYELKFLKKLGNMITSTDGS